MESKDRVKKFPFYLVALAGTYNTWGRTLFDGSLGHLTRALHGPRDYILPGTQYPLRKSFTGIYWPVDYLLDVLIVFFWEVVDGSHPATSVIGIYFLGQYLSVLTTVYIDSLRTGNKRAFSLSKATIWLATFQMTAAGCSGAMWALAYVSSSPLASTQLPLRELQSASIVSPRSVYVLVPSLALGYVGTAIAMALPSPLIVSNNTQQLTLVLWNIFPVLVFLVHRALSFLGEPEGVRTKSQKAHVQAVRRVYLISALASFFIHAGISTLSLSTLLFPNLFSSAYVAELHPASLALPPIFYTPGRTVGDGVRSFLLWDQVFGYAVAAFVALRQYRAACIAKGREFGWGKAVFGTTVASVVAGPGVACLCVSWLRDEMLFVGAPEVEQFSSEKKQ